MATKRNVLASKKVTRVFVVTVASLAVWGALSFRVYQRQPGWEHLAFGMMVMSYRVV
tara:strand:- start:2986 stop:3156 length:171 start_codon:yes stop_codon:yes gene_type:complete